MTVIVQLMGGLGNWLFQIAFSEYLKQFGIYPKLEIASHSPHSSEEYMDTILREWKSHTLPYEINFIVGRNSFTEERMQPYDWIQIARSIPNLTITGYFQNYNYIPQTFIEKLKLPSESLNRHIGIKDTVFIHIRGGDYVNHPIHDVKLDNYYSRAIHLFPEGTTFSIFTNDVNYANTKSFLKSVPHEFINEGELDSLYLMSKCKGGICANSTFSWWGAYLNTNRKLILPSKWWNDPSMYCSDGLYFHGSITLEV